MSNFKQFVRKAVPIVLTVVGSASTIAAVIFAAKEGPKYQKILEEKGDEIKPIEKVTTAVKVFGPAIGCAAASVACGIGAHMMDMHTQASIMGAHAALAQAYKKHIANGKELDWVDGDKELLKESEAAKLPPDVMREVDDKKYTVNLKNISDKLGEITFEATKEDLLWKIIAVNMEIGRCGAISANRLLELFELNKYKYAAGDCEGWSFPMIGVFDGNEWLMFDYFLEDDGTLTCYPVLDADENFLSAWDLDPDILDDMNCSGPELIKAMRTPVV